MLKEWFRAAEFEMLAELTRLRAGFMNSTNRGSGVEAAVRAFLSRHLPRSLTIGHGEAVDLRGCRSAQTDVIVATADHPFTYPPESAGLYFVEGIAAAGEVKSSLGAGELDDAIEKARRFRTLRGDPGLGTVIQGNQEDIERWSVSPPYFVFAMSGNLSEATALAKLRAATVDGALGGLDAVFVLGLGCAINYGRGNGVLKFGDPTTRRSEPGWHTAPNGGVLLQFLGWLSVVMQQVRRFRPIFPPYFEAAARETDGGG